MTKNSELPHSLLFIPIGLTFGAVLAILFVPLFNEKLTRIHLFGMVFTRYSFHLYEFLGILLILLISMAIALRGREIGAILMLCASILAYTSAFNLLDEANSLFPSLLGWTAVGLVAFLIIRGILTLLWKPKPSASGLKPSEEVKETQ